MAVVEFTYDFYNPRNPKCRACRHWDNNNSFVGVCRKPEFTGRRHRQHNAKACRFFELLKEHDAKDQEDCQENN